VKFSNFRNNTSILRKGKNGARNFSDCTWNG
jgi:hypothetical protein